MVFTGSLYHLKIGDILSMKADVEKLNGVSKRIRQYIIKMLYKAGSGHPGGSLSSVEILVSLYFYKMRYDSKNPKWPDRDRFVLSKGHGVPALYAVLAEAGFFPASELDTLRKLGSRLQGHASVYTPGIEASTGSLGTGISIANGMALAAKLDKKDYNVYVLLGDGELQEGSIWEAAMSTVHYGLRNVTAIVDRNRVQQTGMTEGIMKMEPLEDKWRGFGWNAIRVNGHDISEIIRALDAESDRPKVIIADTVKGKGVSFMENRHEWHGMAPNEEQFRKAMEELR